PMRGTLHFVAAEDVRWMIKLLAPRAIARSLRRQEQLNINHASLARSNKLVIEALEGGNQLTRKALLQILDDAQIPTANQRGYHILWRLAEDGVICLAPREGKQQTFALLDEWVPTTLEFSRDEALATLARRYFSSHGPATLQDFVWWSGLSTVDAKAGLQLVNSGLLHENIKNRTYWWSENEIEVHLGLKSAFLLPAFDEYLVGYKDRSAALSTKHAGYVKSLLTPTIILEGQVVGTWKRSMTKDAAIIAPTFFSPLTTAERQACGVAATQYADFYNKAVKFES
ncbi:MAG TPA: winged helix DNA-binding domain-containing protein, partial [Candidatus Lokiarchaeia archaeon]|nr:winged helix DNA-binding domain-containing protein [Candidatus Lokiarchaeia archaeon]